MRPVHSIGRGIDYLGSLSRILGELAGYTTLAFELIQNADDAGADTLIFDITDDALEVWNSAVFTDCGDQDLEPNDCLFLGSLGHRCDFHSFRLVSGEDKRDRSDTTGAFGIGFTAVYQITDRPELISANRHWAVDETKTEDRRIDVCGGCPLCEGSPTGTRFVLPWAIEADSQFRLAVSAPAVDADDSERLLQELVEVVPTAALFLRSLRTIELRRAGATRRRVVRDAVDEDVLLEVDGEVAAWRILRGDFNDLASDLRAKHPRIEPNRSSDIAIAIPYEGDVDGRLCAFLPTRERTGLPFHVNADFYPAPDRSHLPDHGYRGAWNRAAVGASARVLASRIVEVRDVVGALTLWKLILSAWERRFEVAGDGVEEWLGQFWQRLAEVVAVQPLLRTTSGAWAQTDQSLILRDPAEWRLASPLLESLGVSIADESLREILYQLPRSRDLGLKELNLELYVDALADAGFDSYEVAAKADGVRLTQVWGEIEILLARPGVSPAQLDHLYVVPTWDGRLERFELARRGDDATQLLFGVLGPAPLVDEVRLGTVASALLEILPPFQVDDATAFLEGLVDGGWTLSFDMAPDLIGWFAGRTAALNEQLSGRIAGLPIFPSTADLHPLNDLILPGDFQDELGLAQFVDVGAVQESLPLLKRLGASPLTIVEYAQRVVPSSIDIAVADPERWVRVVVLLARRLGDLRDNPVVKSALVHAPLVLTRDGFGLASETYFPSPELDQVFGDYRRAELPAEHEESVVAFYEWLGVVYTARRSDLMQRIANLTSNPPAPRQVDAVQQVFSYLSDTGLWEDDGFLWWLKTAAWLPGEDSVEWLLPRDLAAGYQRFLFETQAQFIALPIRIQQRAADLLNALEVQLAPEPDQVVDHLLECARQGVEVNTQVYQYLSRSSEHPALSKLQGQPCILTSHGDYLRPSDLFRSSHPFGEFRSTLGPDMREYETLWTRLGVRELPEPVDAVSVLVDVGKKLGATNRALTDDEEAVVHASWLMIENGLNTLEDSELDILRTAKCVPDRQGVLILPTVALFEDAPEYADALGQRAGSILIKKAEGGWRAMARVGVRNLSSCVEVEVHELSGEAPDTELISLLAERRRQIARAFDPFESARAVLDRLDELSFTGVNELEVSYRLRLEGSAIDIRSQTLQASVLFTGAAVTRLTNGGVQTVDVARELARALVPEVERTFVVPALALALGGATAGEADRALDSAGIPRLAAGVFGAPQPAVMEAFGGDEGVPGEYVEGSAWSFPANASETPTESDGEEGTIDASASFEVPRGESDRQPSRSRSHLRREPRRGRLRSYVVPGGLDRSSSDSSDVARSPVDEAGVQVVLSYERAAGRLPIEMRHDHPGYDIESCNVQGDVLRYIEVKSLSAEWTEYGAGMTSRQLREGGNRRDTFWLYVVEHALDDPTVYAINDPISKADQFLFDDTWKLLSDPVRRPIESFSLTLTSTVGGECLEGSYPLYSLDEAVRRFGYGDLSVAPRSCVLADDFDSFTFVCGDPDERGVLWLMREAPPNRAGRLLLIEHEAETARPEETKSVIGWYASRLEGSQIEVTISPPDNSEVVVLRPSFEDDVAIVAEVVGRGALTS